MSKQDFIDWFYSHKLYWPTPDQCYDKIISSIKPEHHWLTEKPEFTEDCLLIAASKYRPDSEWHYTFFEIVKTDSDEGWYWAIFNEGMEWGDLADLSAQKYKIIKPL